MADILVIGKQRLLILVNEGVLPRHSHGRYDVKKVVPAYLAYLTHEANAGEPSSQANFSASRADLYRFRAEREQLELSQLRGELVDIEQVVGGLQNAYALMRQMLLGIGSKLAPRLALITSVPKIRAMLDDEHSHALTEFANAKVVNGRHADSAGGSDSQGDAPGGAGRASTAKANRLGVGRRESETVGRSVG